MNEIRNAVINTRTSDISYRIETLDKIERPKDPAEGLDFIHAQTEKIIITDENNELNLILEYNAGSQGLRLADLVIAKSKNLVVENLAKVNASSSLDTLRIWLTALEGEALEPIKAIPIGALEPIVIKG